MQLPDDLRTFTVEAVADLLGVRAGSVRIWAREGRIEAMRWGGRLHFSAAALQAFQEACRVKVPDARAFVRKMRRTYKPRGE